MQIQIRLLNWSGSALFVIQYVIFIHNLDRMILLAENSRWAWHLNLFSMARVKMCIGIEKVLYGIFQGLISIRSNTKWFPVKAFAYFIRYSNEFLWWCLSRFLENKRTRELFWGRREHRGTQTILGNGNMRNEVCFFGNRSTKQLISGEQRNRQTPFRGPLWWLYNDEQVRNDTDITCAVMVLNKL